MNKLTEKERETLNRCLKDRVVVFMNAYNIPNQKIVSLGFNPTESNRNFIRIIAALKYFISKEKIRNENDFKIGVSYLTNTITDGEKINILFELSSHKNSSNTIFPLLILVKKTTDKIFVLMLKFKDGNFEEDKPKNINKGKIFTSDKCVICLEEEPKVYFVDCGHICLCENCDENAISAVCPICKTENNIKRKLNI